MVLTWHLCRTMTQNILFLIHRKLVFNFLKNAQVIRDLPLNCSRQKNKTKKKIIFAPSWNPSKIKNMYVFWGHNPIKNRGNRGGNDSRQFLSTKYWKMENKSTSGKWLRFLLSLRCSKYLKIYKANQKQAELYNLNPEYSHNRGTRGFWRCWACR